MAHPRGAAGKGHSPDRPHRVGQAGHRREVRKTGLNHHLTKTIVSAVIAAHSPDLARERSPDLARGVSSLPVLISRQEEQEDRQEAEKKTQSGRCAHPTRAELKRYGR